MKKILLCGILFSAVANHLFSQTKPTLTVDKIMQDPKWIGTQPTNVFWGTDSRHIYFNWNPETVDADSLYSTTTGATAPIKVPFKDRQITKDAANGVYNSARTKLLFSHKGDIYLQDVVANKILQITATADREYDPRFISNDQWVVYTRSQNLYAWSVADGTTKQLTNIIGGSKPSDKPASKTLQDSTLAAEQLQLMAVIRQRKEDADKRKKAIKATEEIELPAKLYTDGKGLQGLTISPDGNFITYNLYTEPEKNHNTIVPNYVTESSYTEDIFARTNVGEALGKYDFYFYDIKKDSLFSISMDDLPGIKDLPDYVKDYPAKYKDKKPASRPVFVADIYWNDASNRAVVNILSQDNKDRWLMELNTATGKLKTIDRQRDEAWIDGPGIGYGASMGWVDNETVWYQSEASGYSHLYTSNLKTGVKKQLTKGNYEVQQSQLSTDKQWFYIVANATHPGEKNWYRLALKDGSVPERITSLTGGYEVSLSPDEKWIAYRYSYINKPWELYVQENKPGAKPVQITNKATSAEFTGYPWREAQVTTIKATDGALVYARVYTPEAAKKNGAAVIFVHGAGYLQNAHKWWSSYFREYMFHNLLADEGYTVIDIDYRGSAGYGRDWRTGIYRHMGGKDLDDQIDAAKWLVDTHGIDASRIGIYGGSYGGFITLMAMFTKPGVFKAGAGLRSVTDWAHYNHGYTSNILNEPYTDSIAYRRSSPIYFAEGFTKGRLLICHGMVDENVHFQDVVRLSQRLIELKKDNWEMAIYPMEDHGFVAPSSWTDEYKRILKLFREELGQK